MHYPTEITGMNQALQNLAKEPPKDGLAAISYRSHYIIQGLSNPGSTDADTVIKDQNTILSVKCVIHDHDFTSKGRHLFNRSFKTIFLTCRFCDNDAGYNTQAVNTYHSIGMDLNAAAVPFRLNIKEIPEAEMRSILKHKDKVPLVCTNKLPDGTECGFPVSHTVNNIWTALKQSHLHCQGPCDAKKKGKARRKTFAVAAAELNEARGGTYELTDENYRKKSQSVKVTHVPCGQVIMRSLADLAEFPDRNKLPKDTIQDCPFCAGRLARRFLESDPARYGEWLRQMTEGAVAYRGGSLDPADRLIVPLDVECLCCGTFYSGKESQLLRAVAHGCPVCTHEVIHSQRAWVLDEAREIVARRGYCLQGDPESYSISATLLTFDGKKSGYDTILDLVQALPATAGGFGRPEVPAWDMSGTGKAYSLADVEFIRTAHLENRSKVLICRALRRTYGSVSQKCKKLGLRFDEKDHATRRMVVNDEFFSELTVRSAYWAGLLAADGCLGKDITIELKAIDEAVLQKFMADLGHPGTLSYRIMQNSTGGRGLYAGLRFQSRKITKDLEERYRLTKRKSKTLAPPDLQDKELILAYISGLLEGDGSVKVDRRGSLFAILVTASHELATWLADQIARLVGVDTRVCEAGSRGNVHYTVGWYGRSAEKVLGALREVSVGAMERKWRVFEEYMAGRKG